MSAESIELLPCPFCGGEAWMCISDAPQILRIECRECHAATTSFVADSIGEKEAAAIWNTRHMETCTRKPGKDGYLFCSECGCNLTGDWARYCPSCGRKVES